ncbi:hypothetical protein Q0590_23565 [Rhodocytophaga aerolata]|uniref:Uncharacterized protein n=1 Tax=Rhodocytophaga aerolata TaxID=455078 RepID=A0ABT8RC52_9BACT|nr:hypothetical protein [Rhodocytophaga aerolata]MDO1449276.1 hypothetical protein [Rhodocytophaga aerolata]
MYYLRTYIASLLLIIYLFAQAIQAMAIPSSVATGNIKIRKECKFKKAKKQKLTSHSWVVYQNQSDEASVPAEALVIQCGADITNLPYSYAYSLESTFSQQIVYLPGVTTHYTSPNLLTDVGPPKMA